MRSAASSGDSTAHASWDCATSASRTSSSAQGWIPATFHVCVADLEDELVRALGAAHVESVLEAHGNLDAFRVFQNQPAWRGRPVEAQLRRFLCASDRRKLRYARFLVEAAVDGDCVPRPLDAVLASAASA